MDKLKQLLTSGQRALGTHICMNDCATTEIIGGIGFDYLWIDTEHTSIGLDCLERHLIAARAAGISAIVRVPANDPIRLKPVLEMGPDGIVIPMVNSREEAENAVRYCLYPPRGVRGFGPRHASRYGETPISVYLENAPRDTMRMIQIEHIDAVRDLSRIVTVPEIDAYIIGPCDLAASVDSLSNVYSDKMIAIFTEVIQKVHAAGKPVGVSYGLCGDDVIARWIDLGIDMISIAAETDFILSGAKRLFCSMKNISKVVRA